MRTYIHRFGLLVAIAFVLGGAAVRPPPGGGTGGGTIFYTHAGIKTTWTMNSDGTSPTQFGFGTYGPVSTVLYNNHRWFLDTRLIPDSFYLNGSQRVEVFALRSDYDFNLNNNSATRVQLTDDVTLQPGGDGLYSLDWVPGGQAISFKARRWSSSEPDATIIEGGIYTASLLFGADGNIVGLAALPTAPAVAFPLGSDLWPVFRTYCWDHTGSKVAYEDTTALRVADLLGNPHQTIFNGNAHTPRWSPDGTKIAFATGGSIWTMRPDGSNRREIIRRTSLWTFDRPYYSPSGTHIVCYGGAASGQPYNLDVFRATATGGGLTNLTNTPPNGGSYSEYAEFSMGWR